MPGDAFDKLGSLIPDFFYDVIGRVTPGAILLGAIAWDSRLALAPLKEISAALVVPLVLLFSYAIGIIIDIACGGTIGLLSWYIFRALHHITAKDVWGTDVWQVARESNDPHHASVLKKMMAERSLLRSLVALWIALWVFDFSLLAQLSFMVKASALVGLLFVYYRMEFSSRFEASREVTRAG
jgi:hypothetical protein